MQTLLQDLRYAARQFTKSPGFTAIAVASLALAIGANTTIFSLANQMFFVALGVPQPGELRVLSLSGGKHVAIHDSWGQSRNDDGVFKTSGFTFPIYQQLARENKVLGPIVAHKGLSSMNVTANGNAQAVRGELVSGDLYGALQVRPELGRGILPSDDGAPGSGSVVVISDAFWHDAFGGSPDAVGKTVLVDSKPLTVVGVNPASFTGLDRAGEGQPQLFLPMSLISTLRPGTNAKDDPLGPNLWWVQLMARARPGVSDAQAEAALNVAMNAAIRATMTLDKEDTVPQLHVYEGGRGDRLGAGESAKLLDLLLGFAGLVLLLACANIANLMLARATGRRREMSVRMALGAGRGRVVRQMLTESLLLAAMGGLGGLFLGHLGRNVIPALTANAWEGAAQPVDFDWRVFAFTASATLATGVLFGILPAWSATRAEINTALKEGSRSASRRRGAWSGKAIVGFQVALSTLLVTSALFFLRTVMNLNRIDPGFQAENLLLADVNPPAARYPAPHGMKAHKRLEDAFAAIPGVDGVTAAAVPLVAGSMWNSGFLIEGVAQPAKPPEDDMDRYPDLDKVGPDFFRVMSIPILAGRGFTAQDTETAPPVSVINQALARKFFPGQNPIGKRFRMSDHGADASRWIEIVGICADTRYHDLKDPPPPVHFDDYRQEIDTGGLTYVIRSRLKPAELVPALRRAAARIDPDLPLTQVRTEPEQIAAMMQEETLFASLTAGFGVLALALACVGIYGIMAYTVSQRTNEIGVRLALGAMREQIRAMVLRESAWLAGAGVVAGLAAALALVRLIASMLYGVKAWDPVTLAGSVLLLLFVALVAGYIPANRASKVEPIEALRNE